MSECEIPHSKHDIRDLLVELLDEHDAMLDHARWGSPGDDFRRGWNAAIEVAAAHMRDILMAYGVVVETPDEAHVERWH